MIIEIIIAVIILLALVFLATVDMAFYHLSDVSLRRISADEDFSDKRSSVQFLREILENRPRFRLAISSAIQILLVVFTVLLTVIFAAYIESKGRLLFFAVLIGLVATVLLRQILPRQLVQHDTETKLLFLLPAIRPLYVLVSFFLEPIAVRRRSKARARIDSTVAPDPPGEDTDDHTEDFQALMEVGEAEGILEENERELIETMVEFSETLAGEIMTPRTEISGLSIESTILDARSLIIEEKYSRLPVYRETIDNIEGMIYVRDLLQAWADGRENAPVTDILRAPFFVPETKTAAELLKSMQANHVQIAVVIDEYGGVAGLITVEDILEEIVGEIEDEDTGQEEIVEIVEGSDGYWEVLGSTEIDKIERHLDIEFDDEDFTTIAGLVTSEAGYVPKVGERLSMQGLDIEVLKADEKKLHLLRLRRSETEGPDAE